MIVFWSIENFKKKVITKSKVSLAYLDINYCCHILSVKFTFALIDDINYLRKKKLDSKNIYTFDIKYIFL